MKDLSAKASPKPFRSMWNTLTRCLTAPMERSSSSRVPSGTVAGTMRYDSRASSFCLRICFFKKKTCWNYALIGRNQCRPDRRYQDCLIARPCFTWRTAWKHRVYRSGCSHSGTSIIESMNPIPLHTCISNKTSVVCL